MSKIIFLYKKDKIISETIVDDEDFEFLSKFKWRLDSGYACRGKIINGKYKTIFIHRELMNLTYVDQKTQVDHINRDRLDNQKSNLRIVTFIQNHQNRTSYKGSKSKYRGIYFHKFSGLWHARGSLNNKVYSIGYFKSEDEAGKAASDWRRENMPYSEEDKFI